MTIHSDTVRHGRSGEVLRWIWDGKCTKEIADAMGVSPKTVEWYRANLFRCFNVDNPVTLCRRALEAGLLKSDNDNDHR